MEKTIELVDKNYNVLSLDGGGVRGLITLKILANIEERLSKEKNRPDYKLTEDIDCIVGTSAGGLITLALASGYSCREL